MATGKVKMAGFSESNTNTQLNLGKEASTILAITFQSKDFIPRFALGHSPKVRQLPSIKEIIGILNRDAWAIASGFLLAVAFPAASARKMSWPPILFLIMRQPKMKLQWFSTDKTAWIGQEEKCNGLTRESMADADAGRVIDIQASQHEP